MAVHQPPFDPSRDFKALRFFRFEGVIFSRGDAFPIEGLQERKARQLYETRHIGYAEDEQVRPTRPQRPVPASAVAPNKSGGGTGPIHQLIGDFLDAVARHPRPEGFNQLNADAATPSGQPEIVDAEEEQVEADALVKRLTKKFNRDELLKEAEGLELPEDATKAQIAEALVKAGRGNGSA